MFEHRTIAALVDHFRLRFAYPTRIGENASNETREMEIRLREWFAFGTNLVKNSPSGGRA